MGVLIWIAGVALFGWLGYRTGEALSGWGVLCGAWLLAGLVLLSRSARLWWWGIPRFRRRRLRL